MRHGKSTQESFNDNVNSALLPPGGHRQSPEVSNVTPDKHQSQISGKNDKHGHQLSHITGATQETSRFGASKMVSPHSLDNKGNYVS